MPHMNNVNFPENKFAILFLHTTENKRVKTAKNTVLAPTDITIHYLHLALIFMESEIL